MKFLLITNDFYPNNLGGMTNYYTGLAQGFPAGSLCVFTVAVPDRDVDKNLRFPVYRSRVTQQKVRGLVNTWAWYQQALRITQREGVDIILCGNFSPFAYVAYWLHHRTGIPYFIFFHGNDLLRAISKMNRNSFKKRTYPRILRQASGFIANSRYTARLIAQELGVEHKPVLLCHPGVDWEFLHQPLCPPFKDDSSGCHLLSVGRLAPRKGVGKVIEALPLIADKINPLQYTVVGGKDPSAPDTQGRYRALARRIGVEDMVCFRGFLSAQEMKTLYRQCDILVMVSRLIRETYSVEGFGIVFLEANAFGKPVIGSRSGGIPDAVIAGETGLLVEDPDSVDEIANKILYLCHNRTVARAMGKAGYDRVNSWFGYDRIGLRLVREIAAQVAS